MDVEALKNENAVEKAMTVDEMCVEMTQHPVGQGGLFYGVLRHVNGEHRWMYDCGSFDKKELHREIDLISNRCNHRINEFYLSHLLPKIVQNEIFLFWRRA